MGFCRKCQQFNSAFEKYEEMADKALDKANAMAELNRSSKDQTIEDLTKKYTTDMSVDDELEALKASLSSEKNQGN